jgi:hypothetical protein
MNIALAIVLIFSPSIIEEVFFHGNYLISGTQCVLAEIGILLIGIIIYFKKRKLETSEIYFLLSVVFIICADVVYLSTIMNPDREKLISVMCGETCYSM